MTTNAIVLSIHRMHADRIFLGTKLFELRKLIPKEPVRRVFLYESGGAGIIGSFDVAETVSRTPAELWRLVGERGTTKERFDRYFAGCKVANAFEVKRPVALLKPLTLDSLRQIRGFSPPQSFLIVRPESALSRFLEDARLAELARMPEVILGPIEESEKVLYSTLVTSEISRRYDEITPAFAKQALDTAEAKEDPLAFLTTEKTVLAARDQSNRLVGFTTLTRKQGDALKTGPTVLLAAFRQRGFGQQIRRAVEIQARAQGVRKLYCTCPDDAEDTLRYLIGAGFRIEGHLQRHYSPNRGEFALGKHLVPPHQLVRDRKPERLSARFRNLTSFLRSHLSREIVDVNEADAFRIGHPRETAGIVYEKKPRQLIVKRRAQYISSVTILIPKRGGAVKCVLLSTLGKRKLVEDLVREAESEGRKMRRRKIYFLHRAEDDRFINCLKRIGYAAEGLLQSPYRPGVDHMVLSKFL